MIKRSNVLLVSNDPDLHRTLEIIASTYNCKCTGAEDPKTGVRLLLSGRSGCVIFDLQIVKNERHKAFAKQKIRESGLPHLILNDNQNGSSYRANEPLKIEPIVKFVMNNCNGANLSSGGVFSKLFSRLKTKKA